MALTLGKLTILVGAGIVGSVIASEGRVSDLVSGAFKFALGRIAKDDTRSSTVKKPRDDSLMAQVDIIRKELEMLASNRSVTIVTTSRAGSSKYGIIIVTIVVGYGYIWWKGWRLPDMMFATRRSLSDACTSISKQLENVYSSIAVTKRKLSSQIDGLDCGLDECLETTTRTQEEVSELRGKTDSIGVDVRSVHFAVQTLETKINRIEGKQDLTTEGVRRLCDYAWNLENDRAKERIQAIPSSSLRPALELPPISPARTGSLPPVVISEPSSDSGGSNQEVTGISEVIGELGVRGVANGMGASEDLNNVSPGSGRFGMMRFPRISASFLTRTRSATNGMLQQTRSAASQRL
ncbi:uncharacterized protein LOC21400453 isoform X1 [Morus notabilis]|uniref:uncharacterized protein LOC21400453 isoform X1 n=1 Tax=Morus notabilis TaxID=981085 RepID=UPI000CED6DCE|nr:uncharacterized protein LOC21400453 isoform X1 [Morus notabilis]